jgi:flagellin
MGVLRIYQNPIALNALRNLKVTSSMTSKTLERLSSGMRINRAADDAAGLSISEKLRSQVRGLQRASMNAMDGVSLIQTAEGALSEVHNILQRMRELAVQSANGIYTADDREAIQQEINQLTEEINRISSSAEFNTKKLLDGTMGALISTDDFSKVQAAVTGDVGTGGNFVMKAVAIDQGHLQVQKTDVFAVELKQDAVGLVNYLHTYRADATIETADVGGVGNTGIYQVEVPLDANGSIAVNSPTSGVLTVSAASLAVAGRSIARTFQAEELSSGDKLMVTMNTHVGVVTFSVAVSTSTSMTSLATMISTAANNVTGGLLSNVAFNATGQFSMNVSTGGAAFSVLTTQFVDVDGSGSDLYFEFDDTGVSNEFFQSAQYSFTNNGTTMTGVLSRPAGDSGQLFSIGDATTGAVHVRFDTRYDWAGISVGTNATVSDNIAWDRYSGGNSIQDYGKVWQVGPAAVKGTFYVEALSDRSYLIREFDNAMYTSLVADGWDQTDAILAARGAYISNATGTMSVTTDTVFQGAGGTALENVRFAVDGVLQAGETATFNLSSNNILTADQQNTLQSINRFDEFGVFLGRNTAELTLYVLGSSNKADIQINKNDTLEDLAGKISLAMWNPDGSGVINSGIINGQTPPDLVHVNTIGVAKGTLSITTPMPGAKLVLAGDESLLNALSLFDVREGKAPTYSITAFNLEKGESVGEIITDSDEIVGLLPGIKIFFDNTLGLRTDPMPPTDVNGGTNSAMTSFGYLMPTERPVISLSGDVESFFIHVAPRRFDLQIGANQGQTVGGFIADHSAKALGVEGLLITDIDLAAHAISTIDNAIKKVSEMRSRLGAWQNRLESTIRNIDIAAENLTSAESRIRDANIAEETLLMTRNQILLQAGVAALAQANQMPQTVLQLLR